MQRASWNEFAPGWKKWDELIMDSFRPMGRALLDAVSLRDGETLLDIACGTGEPALTAALERPGARVIATDISEEMVQIALEKARAAGATNMEGEVQSADELPYEDDRFDAITCRLGVMFFPDIGRGLRELARVLKPGGRLALSAWAEPAANLWLALPGKTVAEVLDLPPPDPDAPGVFRCAEEGALARLLEEVGLANVRQKQLTGTFSYDSPDHLWEVMNDVAAPIVKVLAEATAEQRAKVAAVVKERAAAHVKDGALTFTWSAWIASAAKPAG